MISPELAKLTRRVDAHDETLRALGDTVLDIKDTVDRHTETLDHHTLTLTSHTDLLTEILRRLPLPEAGR